MLIFDMDGTLIDSNGIWSEIDRQFLAKRGFSYTKEYYEGVAHTIFPLAAVFTKEYCHLTESTDEIMAEWMEMAGDAYSKVPIKPGVAEYLALCKEKGERMIVLTSSVPEHCYAALTHLGLIDYFEKIIFAQELSMEKRNPEIFHTVAQMMGIKESDCTLFDDSVEACRGAMKAGMKAIGVYDSFFAQTQSEMRQLCSGYITSFESLLSK